MLFIHLRGRDIAQAMWLYVLYINVAVPFRLFYALMWPCHSLGCPLCFVYINVAVP